MNPLLPRARRASPQGVFRRLLLAAALVGTAALAFAQDFPSRPVSLVVPFPAGGGVDVVARQIGTRLGAALGQPVVVDNRAGAGGTIGTGHVAKAAPDGHTLLLGTTSALGVSPALYKDLPYDPLKSFVPVIEVTRGPFVLSVRNSLPVKSVAELLAYARGSASRLNVGSAGVGSVHHLAAELLQQATGIALVHVPYKGGGPAWTALVAGEIDLLFDSMPGPSIHAGRSRPIAIAGPKRLPALADVPTFAEAGYPGVETVFFWAILAPAGTPPDVVARLNAALGQVLRDPGLQAEFARQGMEATPGTQQEIAAFMAREIPRWRRIVQDAHVSAE
jgi:tripartite-type tricarboxylate transporter receptor subunit TctC